MKRLFGAGLCLYLAVSVAPTAIAQDDADVEGLIVRYRASSPGVPALETRVGLVRDVAMRFCLDVRYERSGALETHVLRFDRPLSLEEAQRVARELEESDANVAYAEPDRIMRVAFVPNDPRYNEQWHYHQANVGINLPNAWDISTGTGVTVAVIDTGYRPHADLVGNILPGYDFITDISRANDGNGRDNDAQDPGDACSPDPSSWHGTHVAGTIAASTNNSTGVAGVAFNAKVVPVRALGVCGGTVSDIADAIVWAAGGSVPGVPANANPARVLNLSLGGGGACGPTYQNAINAARGNNAVVVVSAGNSNSDAANFAPANCAGVITVAATDRTGGRASYSNFGTTVEISAPGGDISPILANGVLSTLNTGTSGPGSDSYQLYEGTSMAAPHVSGVVALMLSVNNSLSPDDVLTMLQASARLISCPAASCGAGLVDAVAAVNIAPMQVSYFSLTVGSCGNFMLGQRGLAPAEPTLNCPAPIGSISPTTFAGGRQVTAALDRLLVVSSTFAVQISGFAVNPGAGWLAGVVVDGRRKTVGANYQYSGGTAVWGWVGGNMFAGHQGQVVTLKLIHQ